MSAISEVKSQILSPARYTGHPSYIMSQIEKKEPIICHRKIFLFIILLVYYIILIIRDNSISINVKRRARVCSMDSQTAEQILMKVGKHDSWVLTTVFSQKKNKTKINK